MNYAQVLTVNQLLTELAKTEAKQATGVLPFPGNVRVRLSRLLRDVAQQVEIYDSARVALVKQFGDTQPDGSLKVTDSEKFKAFAVEHDKLAGSESGLTVEPFTDEELATASVPFALITSLAVVGVVKK